MSGKRRDEAAEMYQQPGVTKIKRPAVRSLAEDGRIDLKRFLPADDSRHESQNPHVLNNRELKAKDQPERTTIEYQLGKQLDICKQPKDAFIEVKFSREHLQQAARQMKKRNLWGTRTYTSDSDLLCALVHMGYLPARALEPSFSWPETMRELNAILQICSNDPPFTGGVRNGVRSRSWDQECYMCGFVIRRCWMAVLLPGASAGGNLGNSSVDVELDSLPDHSEPEAAKPYFILSHFDHRISTRQVTFHGGINRRRTQSEVATILYNLVNEPWLKYTPSLIADCGFAAHLYTVSKFQREALYIETERMRYEICMISDAKKSSDTPSDLTCLAFYVCKEILPEDIHTQSGVPLPADQKDCVCPCVAWEDLQWGATSLVIDAKHIKDELRGVLTNGSRVWTIPVLRMHWLKVASPF